MQVESILEYLWSIGVFSTIVKGSVVILAVIIVLLAGNSIIHKYFRRAFKKRKNINKVRTVEKVVKNIFQLVVLFIGTAIFLNNILGVDTSSILTVAGVSGLALGFASQTLVKDFLSGILILLEDSIGIGDMVEINSYKGTVEDIGLRSISLRGENKAVYVIPNNEVRAFTNHSKNVQ